MTPIIKKTVDPTAKAEHKHPPTRKHLPSDFKVIEMYALDQPFSYASIVEPPRPSVLALVCLVANEDGSKEVRRPRA